MNKRILCLVLALVMVLGAFSAVFAEESKVEVKDVPKYTNTDHKIQWLQDNGIVSGRKVNANGENNDLALDKTILRGEVTKLLVYAIGKQDLATQLANVVRAFKDVEPTHWANGYIAVGTTSASPANGLPFLNGYPDGTFHADWNVNYAELAKMLVVLTKKDLTPAMIKSANANWPSTWLTWAAQGGIFDGVKYVNSSDNAIRKDAFAMIYNALYAMKEWRLYPTSESIGVISGYKTGKLYLNGDEKKEFTVNENTYFVPAKDGASGRPAWMPVLWSTLVTKYAGEGYYLGSLVRVITNDKNEVTHIIQLGNPKDLDLETQGWAPVADGHFNGSVALRKADLTFKNGATISVDSKTRYFVADYEKGQFGELKDMTEVRKLFNNDREYAERVYVGFEKVSVSGRTIARLVVFNKVDKGTFSGDTVRISDPVSSLYNVYGQKAGTTPTEKLAYKLSGYNFYPYGYKGVDRLDVAKLNKYNGTIENIIDHSEDPIYEITKVYKRGQNGLPLIGEYGYITSIELYDGKGKQEFGVSEDTLAWFTNQIKVGERVQVKFNKAENEITHISVLPEKEALRGILPKGQLVGEFTAEYKSFLQLSLDKTPLIRVQRDGKYEETIACVGVYDENDKQVTLTAGEEYVFTPVYESYGYRTVNYNGQTLVVYKATPVKKPAEPKTITEVAVAFINGNTKDKKFDLGEITKNESTALENTIKSKAQALVDKDHNETVEVSVIEFNSADNSFKLVFTDKADKTKTHTTNPLTAVFTVAK